MILHGCKNARGNLSNVLIKISKTTLKIQQEIHFNNNK